MARAKNRVQASELQGFKYFEMITALLTRLQPVGAERDKAGNRDLFCDQDVSLLLLLYFVNPVITGFNALQHATGLE